MLDRQHERRQEEREWADMSNADKDARRHMKYEKQLCYESRSVARNRWEMFNEDMTSDDRARERRLRLFELSQMVSCDEEIVRKQKETTAIEAAIQDMKGAIRVYARGRPMSTREISEQRKSKPGAPFGERYKECVEYIKENEAKRLQIAGVARGRKQAKTFIFDQIFGPESTQDQVFEDTRQLLRSVVNGRNFSIFAYGQTGSGKTFTMAGTPEFPGITPRCIDQIFEGVASRNATRGGELSVRSYFLELYNDSLRDLYWSLDNGKKKKTEGPKLKINVDRKTNDVSIEGAVIKTADSPAQLKDLFERGNHIRHTSATTMNAESSRSHSIFAVLVYDRRHGRTGKLSLIDLAGSERLKKTNVTNKEQIEAERREEGAERHRRRRSR